MSRRDDLESAIQESYELIREYEAIMRTSDRPKEKARARREIEEQQSLIKGYQAELEMLAGEGKPREEQTQPPPATQIHTGGGMYVAGNVINRGVMVGRDQQVDGDVVLGDKVEGGEAGHQQTQPRDQVNSPGESLRVFLCHASEDKQAVRRLYEQLRAEGVDPWSNEENLLPGQSWQREIRNAVRAAHVVAVCLSRYTNRAGFFQKEIRQALDVADEQPDGAIFVIPVRLEECEVPDRLSEWQWVDLFSERGYERLLLALQARAESLGIAL